MAEGGIGIDADSFQWIAEDYENLNEQKDEVLAFQSLFEIEGDQRFSVVNHGPANIGDDDDDQVFTLQFLVPVQTPCESIKVNVCIPEEEIYDDDKHKDIVLQRSESRNVVFASFEVKFLTPLRLTVILPPGYPSNCPPIYTLSSLWLNGDQLTSLCLQLDKLWEECPSMPILNTWIDWLEHNTVSHFSVTDTVFIQQFTETGTELDNRAVVEYDNIDDTVNEMLRYNLQEEMTEFQKYEQECGICFCEKPGRDFYRLMPCKHHFCNDCLSEHCSVHVKEGTVQNLLCPETKCTTEINPYILQEVLDQDSYQRWERLNLQFGLDMMGDIIYCPKCQNVVVKEDDLGHCLSCMFQFCTRCQEKWHQGEACFFDREDLQSDDTPVQKTKDENINKGSHLAGTGELDEDAKKSLQRQRKIEMILSRDLIQLRTRKCNKCKAPIEKDGGCNKVTCSKCGNAMCWSCGNDITVESYDHFKKYPKCSLLDVPNVERVLRQPRPMQVLEIEDAIARGGSKAARNVIKCPRCHQKNIREQGNNHMKCWNCKSHFCFLCKQLLLPPFTKHFRGTLCKQHTRETGTNT